MVKKKPHMHHIYQGLKLIDSHTFSMSKDTIWPQICDLKKIDYGTHQECTDRKMFDFYKEDSNE